MNFSSRLRHNNSDTHIHKEKDGIVVKGYEIIKPDFDEMDYILDNDIKYCRDIVFHTIEYR